MKTILRKATRADSPRISEIRLAVRENRLSKPDSIEPLVDWLFEHSAFWVWEEDAAIQGFSAGDPRDGSVCALSVHPSHEGRGIGRALLPLACDTLRESGHVKATLYTEPATRAERFYRVDGWRSGEKTMARSSSKRACRSGLEPAGVLRTLQGCKQGPP